MFAQIDCFLLLLLLLLLLFRCKFSVAMLPSLFALACLLVIAAHCWFNCSQAHISTYYILLDLFLFCFCFCCCYCCCCCNWYCRLIALLFVRCFAFAATSYLADVTCWLLLLVVLVAPLILALLIISNNKSRRFICFSKNIFCRSLSFFLSLSLSHTHILSFAEFVNFLFSFFVLS